MRLASMKGGDNMNRARTVTVRTVEGIKVTISSDSEEYINYVLSRLNLEGEKQHENTTKMEA